MMRAPDQSYGSHPTKLAMSGFTVRPERAETLAKDTGERHSGAGAPGEEPPSRYVLQCGTFFWSLTNPESGR